MKPQLLLLNLLLAHAPSTSRSQLRILSVERVVSVDAPHYEDSQGYLLVASNQYHW